MNAETAAELGRAVLTPTGLPPMENGPVSMALATMMAEERVAEGDRPVAYGRRLRGSMAGKCSRAIGFEILGFAPDLGFETTTLIAFEMGDAGHDIIQRTLVAAFGAELEVPADWSPTIDLAINSDGVYPDRSAFPDAERVNVEIKTVKAFAFDIATGVRERGETGPKYEHLLQAGLGALAPSINAATLHIIYMSKEDGRIAEWLIPLDDPLPHLEHRTVREMVAAELVRFTGILGRLDAGELPRAVVPGFGLVQNPPPRAIKTQPWQCRYCRWQPTCSSLGPDVVTISSLKTRNQQTETEND